VASDNSLSAADEQKLHDPRELYNISKHAPATPLVLKDVIATCEEAAAAVQAVVRLGLGTVNVPFARELNYWDQHGRRDRSEQCSAGISERAYLIWVLSSALFLGHSITIGDVVFMVTQLVNIVALAIILVLARRYRNQICTAHALQLHIHEQAEGASANRAREW